MTTEQPLIDRIHDALANVDAAAETRCLDAAKEREATEARTQVLYGLVNEMDETVQIAQDFARRLADDARYGGAHCPDYVRTFIEQLTGRAV